MRLPEAQAYENLCTHISGDGVLTYEDLDAVLSLQENGIKYFLEDVHAVTEVFGTVEAYHRSRSNALGYASNIMLQAS